ncbi:MAG: anti-sigma factor [Flavitalea sp.]
MNVQEYISSGIVESYVLGLADAVERSEFDRMCLTYPEVLNARIEFENSLEQFATMNQVIPPTALKSRIFAEIDPDGNGENPMPVLSSVPSDAYEVKGSAKIRSIGWQRYIAAAAVVLLLISTTLNFYFFNKYREYDKRYEALVMSNSELATHNQVIQTKLLAYENAVDKMKDPNMAVVKMPSIPSGPDPRNATTVYWDKVSKDVYLSVNKLPEPGAGHQFQLWAMVDGKPVDAGVFDLSEGNALVKMKNIPHAQAFAITLEKTGGSPTPTMENLYVLGKV